MAVFDSCKFIIGDAEDPPPFIATGEFLGAGGFGKVFSAMDLLQRSPIAIKIFDSASDDTVWTCFETEINFYSCMGKKPRKWAPKYYYEGETMDGEPWFAIEKLGQSMDKVNFLESCPVLRQQLALGMLSAVEGLHKEGYIHRDIKPGNFMTKTDPSSWGPTVAMIDFGLVKEWVPGSWDGFESFCGTHEYASSRQLKNRRVGPADDLESLCYTLFTCLTHSLPWNHPTTNMGPSFNKLTAESIPAKHSSPDEDRNSRKRKQTEEVTNPTSPRQQKRAMHAQLSIPFAPGSVREMQTRTFRYSKDLINFDTARKEIWERLTHAGKIPDFLLAWMKYCQGLGPGDTPDYKYLRGLIKGDPSFNEATIQHTTTPASPGKGRELAQEQTHTKSVREE